MHYSYESGTAPYLRVKQTLRGGYNVVNSKRVANIVDAQLLQIGRASQNEILEIPESGAWIWLIEGKAQWKDQVNDGALLERADLAYEIPSGTVLNTLEACQFVWLRPATDLGFGAHAAGYRAEMESRNANIGRALVRNIPFTPGQTWVDVGTGTGAMISVLYEANPNIWVLGVDQSPKMLQEAWRHHGSAYPVWLVERPLEALYWPHNMIDGVTALLVLHLVDHVEQVVREIFQALKPGGMFAYAVSADGNPFVRMVMRQLATPGTFFRRGSEPIHRAVQQVGFNIERREIYSDRIELPSPEAMRALISDIGGPASRGLRDDIVPPKAIDRRFELVWAIKP
jgi:ubiquinone/menaquinone biosynthesis C-methylase UbiE